MRTLRRFFFSPSPPAAAAAAEVFVAFFALSVVFAGAFEAAVEAGAFEAVETGLGAIWMMLMVGVCSVNCYQSRLYLSFVTRVVLFGYPINASTNPLLIAEPYFIKSRVASINTVVV